MIRRIIIVISLCFCCLPHVVRAQSVPLVADLENHLVAITTGFTGTDVLLFGATDGPGDLVILVRGPAKNVSIRRKERFGPIWANTETIELRDIPSFYSVASNGSPEDFVSLRLLERYQIGLQNLRVTFADQDIPSEIRSEYRDALLRLNQERKLYKGEIGRVSLLANRLFRTELHFPANVPTGIYFVEIYLFRDGDVASAEIVPLSISKIGVGAEIYDFAHNLGPLYGLVAIIVAVLAGWAAESAFRRR
ncbi:MAG: TIGR02186 family protein [Rhodospirillaceae bacterium]